MKSQKGISAGGCLAILFVLGIIALVVIPNFMSGTCERAACRDYKPSCPQSLGTLRKVMEMYANDNEKSYYPAELNGRPGMNDDLLLLNSLSMYTNVTNTLRSCSAVFFTAVTKDGYTISAWAKDSKHTLLTATVDTIIQP